MHITIDEIIYDFHFSFCIHGRPLHLAKLIEIADLADPWRHYILDLLFFIHFAKHIGFPSYQIKCSKCVTIGALIFLWRHGSAKSAISIYLAGCSGLLYILFQSEILTSNSCIGISFFDTSCQEFTYYLHRKCY